ncbi:hypothetical protein [Belliella pelovolcani]|uniref:hypothetical protein n=1 Tax=Belliella pelovolcani TaxID=529505 RepID=UPI00391B4EF1
MSKKYLFILTSLAIFNCACESNKSNEKNGNFTYELEIIDSLTIDYLGNLELLAIQAEKDLFLFSEDNQLMIFNKAGEKVSVFDKPQDAPDAFGQFVLGATFSNDKIGVLGISKFNIYDMDFYLEKSFKKPYPHKGMIYSGFDHLHAGKKAGKPTFVAFTGGPQVDARSNMFQYYQEYNTLDLIDSEQESFSPIIPFHPNSRYAKGTEAFDFIKPHFQVQDHIVYFTHQNDSLFYQFDLDNHAEFKSEKIPFDKFILNRGYEIGGQQDYETPVDRSGEITHLFQVEDRHVLTYRSGLKLNELPGNEVSSEERREMISKLDPEKLIVREGDGSYSQPSIITKRYRISRVDSKGRIWAHQNVHEMEFEPDQITVYELKLVRKSSK